MREQSVAERYLRGEKRLARINARHKTFFAITAALRFVAFLIMLGAPLVLLFFFPQHADAARITLSALPGLVIFIVLFFYHYRIRDRIRESDAHLTEYRECLRRFTPDWYEDEAFPVHPREGFSRLVEEAVDHPYGGDLNLFGRFSLFQYLNRASSPGGELELAGLLLGQPDAEAVTAEKFQKRQNGIRALARLRVLRMRFRRQDRAGLFESTHETGADWQAELRQAVPPAVVGIILWPAVAIALFTLFSYFAFALDLAKPYFILTLPAQVLLFFWTTWRSTRIARAWARAADRLEVYAGLLRVCAGFRPRQEYLAGFSVFPGPAESGTATDTPHAKVRQLARLAGFFTYRKNPIVHFFLGVFGVYELFLLRALERWREKNLDDLPRWLEDLGRFDALLSLAEFAADHPDFVWPDHNPVEDESPRFTLEAEDLSHPLLAPGARVGNSFSFAPEQGLWLISGSNMSGKSTFLRSVGTALLLAMIGAPVCARRFVFRPARLWTSITVRDDLRRSLSLFYSEVKRIRLILDEASERRPPLFYLIDEMLHGTNSRERNIACRAILRQLRERGSAGMITTHDLDLLDLCGAGPEIHCAHFEEIIVEDRMSFDYLLKEGPVTRSNALKILAMEGIEIN